MSYRILCLHGMGSQASVFASQMDCVRDILPASYEFHFVDGQLDCDPAEEVVNVYPGPYRCWYTSPSTRRVAAAHERLKEMIRINGPFDAVLGFSQGSALAASLLLQHQIENPGAPPPFKAAVFICSPVPFSTSSNHGIDARSYFGIREANLKRRPRPTKIPDYLVTDAAYLKGEADNKGSTYYQMFHHTVDTHRISIPTLHIYGRRDKWRRHSMDLYKLCNAGTAACFEHDGGHEIPTAQAEDISDAIESLMYNVI